MNNFVVRLWRYLNIYFLKPFDALNDTLTSSLILSNSWKEPYLEIGSGDGIFSYIMHGGKFPLSYDRYKYIDINKKDIFDVKNNTLFNKLKKIKSVKNLYSIDTKKNHIDFINKIQFADNSLLSSYENIKLDSQFSKSIFLYTPHGVNNYQKILKECYRLLKKNGRLVVLNYNKEFLNYFISYNFSKKYNFYSNFFRGIDNGRYNELKELSETKENWKKIFENIGFKVTSIEEGLSGYAWAIYDIQTRPVLKYLILFFNFFPQSIRTILKIFWMILFYPILLILYIILSNRYFKISNVNCYYSFTLEKV